MPAKNTPSGPSKTLKAKKRDYNYQSLHKCEIGTQVNFFGVVTDATYPRKSFKSNKWIVTVKVTDLSMRKNTKEGTQDSVTVVFFSLSEDNLPKCQRMGELIRVHRACVGEFRGEKQMTADVNFSSSWAIFPLFVRIPPGKKAPTFADEFHTDLFLGKQCRIS